MTGCREASFAMDKSTMALTDLSVSVALLSVSDKTGLADFAKTLASLGVHLMSTGGTRALLNSNELHVQEVADYTGFPEMMDGRLKTLHPKVHGGLLGRREGQAADDSAAMAAHGIRPIDLLVVNLYPFEAAIAEKPHDLAGAIEQIDIGGPAMLRSAAKNFHAVAVVVDVADYGPVADELTANRGRLSAATRFRLAVKAFGQVARYDAAIANYFSSCNLDGRRDEYPGSITLQFERKQMMRYGENPHQSAALYVEAKPSGTTVANAVQLQGKALSYNNIADADAAVECVRGFDEPACVIVKHANPCGVAVAEDLTRAYRSAYRTDPTSAFGGIIALNRELDGDLAGEILEQQFVEVIIAPAATDAAVRAVAVKKRIRLLTAAPVSGDAKSPDYKRVDGGLLVQQKDLPLVDKDRLRVVTERQPTEAEYRDLLFAWQVAKYVKSNAIVYAKERMTIGVGAGQMARVHSAKVAELKALEAGLEIAGSVMASDAFLPFRDSIDTAVAAGVVAVIQPGGSIRDREVTRAANEAGIAMVFTGMRHFRH